MQAPEKSKAYVNADGLLLGPNERRLKSRLRRLWQILPIPFIAIILGLFIGQLICIAGLIEALVMGREQGELTIFIVLIVGISVMIILATMVGTLLPRHESDQIPGSGQDQDHN